MYPKYYIGPMTKNVVDAIIEFCDETNNNIGLIPSRRQVEFDGGYVNNWKTKDFTEYVNGKLLIKRIIINQTDEKTKHILTFIPCGSCFFRKKQ